MNCQEIKNLMFAYMDGELDAAQQTLFAEHLTGCPACTKLLAEYTQTWKLLGAWENIKPRPGYLERFKARLSERKTWQEKFLDNVKALLLPKPLLQTALAMSLFVLVYVSGQTYSNYLTTQNLLNNVSEQEWEMLANLDTIAKMNVVKVSDKGNAS